MLEHVAEQASADLIPTTVSREPSGRERVCAHCCGLRVDSYFY